MKLPALIVVSAVLASHVHADVGGKRLEVEANITDNVKRFAKVGSDFEARYFERQMRAAVSGTFRPLDGRDRRRLRCRAALRVARLRRCKICARRLAPS